MIIRCPDGSLINMDQVLSVTCVGNEVVFEQVNGNLYVVCENEDEARRIVDLIFRARVSRLDLGGSLETVSEKMTPGGSGRE